MKYKLVCLISESSGGKDSVGKELVNKHGYTMAVSHTTRAMRPSEVDGKDYHFISKEKFYEMVEKGLFAEHRKYFTKGVKDGKVVNDIWLYGLSYAELNKKGKRLVILDIDGMLEIAEKIGSENMLTIYLDCPVEVRRQRALKRGDLAEEVERRIKSEKDFNKRALQYADLLVPSDRDLKEVVKDVVEYLEINN